MREATLHEFRNALANARHPEPRRLFTRRTSDAFYSDCGVDVASHHKVTTRGKVTSETYMVNPDYLTPDDARTMGSKGLHFGDSE